MNKAANVPHGPVISGGTGGSHSSASAGGYNSNTTSGASTYTNIINTNNTNTKG